MCEITAYLVSSGNEEEVMQDVAVIEADGDKLVLTDILGQKKTISARIREIRLLEHKVYLE